MEFDIRMSRDGYPMVIHDAALDRTTDGTGLVAEYTREELKKFRITFTKNGPADFPEPIPTLDELLDLLAEFPKAMINCEIKDYHQACLTSVLDRFISRGELGRTVFTCFDYGVLEILKKMNSSVRVQGFPLQLMTSVPRDRKTPEQLFDFIGIKYALADRDSVSAYRALGLTTGVWVINDPQELSACLDLGVDIVTTDRIDLFVQARAGLKKAVKKETPNDTQSKT